MEEIAEGVEFANRYGAKIYVTTNIIAHDENIEGLESYLRNLEKDWCDRYHCCRSFNYRNM